MSVLRRQRPGWEFPKAIRGEGAYIWDEQGRRLLDAAGGAVVVSVGHGVTEIADAIAEQARRLAYVHGSELTSEPVERLAIEMAARAPIDDARMFLVSGGSEATETAIKLARQYQVARGQARRWKIVSRRPSYHGASLGALAISGRPTLRRDFEPMLVDMPAIGAPYPYRCTQAGCESVCTLACVRDLETLLGDGGEEIAAFIAEPVVGASAGALVPPPGYYAAVREICDRHGVLFIADEVMTGVGRTGRWFGMEHWPGVKPDILTTGKGVTSGYVPGGAVLASGRVADTVQAAGGFHHGFTYSHHPVVAAAGLAVIRYIERHDLIRRAAETGEYMQRRLRGLCDLPSVAEARGVGLMGAVELVHDRASRAPYARTESVAQRVQAEALRRGVIVYASGGHIDGDGDLVMLGPPLTITREQIDEAVEALGDAISAVTRS